MFFVGNAHHHPQQRCYRLHAAMHAICMQNLKPHRHCRMRVPVGVGLGVVLAILAPVEYMLELKAFLDSRRAEVGDLHQAPRCRERRHSPFILVLIASTHHMCTKIERTSVSLQQTASLCLCIPVTAVQVLGTHMQSPALILSTLVML